MKNKLTLVLRIIVCMLMVFSIIGTCGVIIADRVYTPEYLRSQVSRTDTYENAYRGIATNYSGLDHYETNITRSGNTVSFEMNIDYDKIDIPALIRIEGEEDNIFENGIPKVQKWLDLAEKFGTKCELVTD